MTGTKRLEFDRETVDTLTRDALANAACRVFGKPGPGEEVNVEISSWGACSAEIRPIEIKGEPDQPRVAVPVPVPTVTECAPF
jgi:hypothetical protein